MSSDESEGEISRLQECVQPVVATLKNDNHNKTIPSNRILLEENKQFDYKNVRVPEKLQKHICQHLDKLLSTTKFTTVSINKQNKSKKKRKKLKDSGAVKLLSTSMNPLDVDLKIETTATDGRMRRLAVAMPTVISDVEREERARMVAVTPEYVLSKIETTRWAPENKGIIEVLK